MFQKIFLSAILAGFLSALIVTALHSVTTVPLILEAEQYEKNETTKEASFINSKHPYLILVHSNAPHEETPGEENQPAPWSPANGFERTLYTGLTTLMTAIGFALLLTAGYAISNQDITGRNGVMWGMAGFAAIALAPAMGLPPELPGSASAALMPKQIWWLVTAISTLTAIALLVFSHSWIMRAIAILLILTPHAVGAPHPESFSNQVPAELQGHFVALSIGCNLILWALLGWFSGTFFEKFSQDPASTEASQ